MTSPKFTSDSPGVIETLVDEVEAWKSSPQQRKRKYQIPLATLTREANPNTDADWVKLTGNALKVAQKMAKGIEGYLVFSPLVRRTEVSRARPATGGCGTIQQAPISAGNSPRGKPDYWGDGFA